MCEFRDNLPIDELNGSKKVDYEIRKTILIREIKFVIGENSELYFPFLRSKQINFTILVNLTRADNGNRH